MVKKTTHVRISAELKKEIGMLPGKSFDEKVKSLCKTSVLMKATKFDKWLGEDCKLFKKTKRK